MTEPPDKGMEWCPQCDGACEVWDEESQDYILCEECDGTGEVESL